MLFQLLPINLEEIQTDHIIDNECLQKHILIQRWGLLQQSGHKSPKCSIINTSEIIEHWIIHYLLFQTRRKPRGRLTRLKLIVLGKLQEQSKPHGRISLKPILAIEEYCFEMPLCHHAEGNNLPLVQKHVNLLTKPCERVAGVETHYSPCYSSRVPYNESCDSINAWNLSCLPLLIKGWDVYRPHHWWQYTQFLEIWLDWQSHPLDYYFPIACEKTWWKGLFLLLAFLSYY